MTGELIRPWKNRRNRITEIYNKTVGSSVEVYARIQREVHAAGVSVEG